MEDKEIKRVLLIILLAAFALGFIVAQAIYDKRPITKEDWVESQKTEWYE